MTTYVLLYWMMLHISASLLYVFLLLWHVRRFGETQHPACSLISPSSWTHCRLVPTHRGQRDATFDLSAPWRVFGSAYLRQAAPFCVSEIATMRRSPPWSQVVKFQWDRPFRKQCWVDNRVVSARYWGPLLYPRRQPPMVSRVCVSVWSKQGFEFHYVYK